MDEIKHWLVINIVVGFERTIFNRLVKAFGSPENVFAASIADIQQVHEVGHKFATVIFDFDVDRSTDRELGLAQK
jgi:ERCC4-type nuclease